MSNRDLTSPGRITWTTEHAVQARLHLSAKRIARLANDEDDRDREIRRKRSQAARDKANTSVSFETIINDGRTPAVHVAPCDVGYSFTAPEGHTVLTLSAAIIDAAEASFGADWRQRFPRLETANGTPWAEQNEPAPCRCGSGLLMADNEGTCAKCGHGHAHDTRSIGVGPEPLRASCLEGRTHTPGNVTITSP